MGETKFSEFSEAKSTGIGEPPLRVGQRLFSRRRRIIDIIHIYCEMKGKIGIFHRATSTSIYTFKRTINNLNNVGTTTMRSPKYKT
jgi:hypothetical protein